MKLIDPDTNKEYEFEDAGMRAEYSGLGTLKPLDTWPKEDSVYWFIDYDGAIISDSWNEGHERETLMGIYRTKQEAEMAAERIMSLQEAKVEYISDDPEIVGNYYFGLSVPSKYLKAWQSLLEDTE